MSNAFEKRACSKIFCQLLQDGVSSGNSHWCCSFSWHVSRYSCWQSDICLGGRYDLNNPQDPTQTSHGWAKKLAKDAFSTLSALGIHLSLVS